jgi:hypothetical protein
MRLSVCAGQWGKTDEPGMDCDGGLRASRCSAWDVLSSVAVEPRSIHEATDDGDAETGLSHPEAEKSSKASTWSRIDALDATRWSSLRTALVWRASTAR